MATKKRNWRTTSEVAAKLNVTDRQVRRMCEKGNLYAVQFAGGRWRIYDSKQDLKAATRGAGFALAVGLLF